MKRKKVRILDIYQKEAKGKREITFFRAGRSIWRYIKENKQRDKGQKLKRYNTKHRCTNIYFTRCIPYLNKVYTRDLDPLKYKKIFFVL